MLRKPHGSAVILLSASLVLIVASFPVLGRQKADYPQLRAALHELREARAALKDSKDSWPPGYKDRALASTQSAIDSVKTILSVKDVTSFKGVDRNADYYKRYEDNPRLRAALQDLRDARDELRSAKADFKGLKEKALDDIDVAVGDIVTLIRHKPR